MKEFIEIYFKLTIISALKVFMIVNTTILIGFILLNLLKLDLISLIWFVISVIVLFALSKLLRIAEKKFILI